MLDLDTPHHWSCAVFICALLLFVSTFYLEIQAQNITHSYNHSLAYDANASVNIDNKAAEHIYQPYQSTIYQPFTSTTPSQSSSSNAPGISGRRNASSMPDGFGHPSDPGNQSKESPIGVPWVILVFASIYILWLKKNNHHSVEN